jgi:hypothetical protein
VRAAAEVAIGALKRSPGVPKKPRAVNGPAEPGHCRRGCSRRKGPLEDFVVFAGAEQDQLTGASDIDQEPIAFAADMALPEPLPLSFEDMVLVARR